MDTPMALVTVLRRRLAAPAEVAAPVQVAEIAPTPVAQPEPQVAEAAVPPISADETPALPPLSGSVPPAALSVNPPEQVAAATAGFVVQAATFSTQDRANRAATALGGAVSPSGTLFRVRTGPFPSRAAAEASLANVRAAGYSDARILTGG
jgi:rare lipoprotein A